MFSARFFVLRHSARTRFLSFKTADKAKKAQFKISGSCLTLTASSIVGFGAINSQTESQRVFASKLSKTFV
jgi:hypothetical protein